MSGLLSSIHVTNLLHLGVLLVLWIVLFKATHLLVTLLRHEPLIGWAIGPLGLTVMVLHEPSLLYIWLDVLCPAFVSGGVLSIGLLTPISPVVFPHDPLVRILGVGCGVLITSTGDFISALRDLRYPLWGDARILRSLQTLHASWAKIHFTSFGYAYLSDHFGSNPTDLLQALSVEL